MNADSPEAQIMKKRWVILCCLVSLLVAYAQMLGASDWKTYRDAAMGFEVKYRADWYASKARGTGPESVLLLGRLKPDGPIVSVQFWIQRRMNPKGLSIQQWYADQMKTIKADPIPMKNVVVGGRPAIRQDAPGHVAFFTLLNKADIFEITINQPSSAGPQIDPSYEDILATLKFLSGSQ